MTELFDKSFDAGVSNESDEGHRLFIDLTDIAGDRGSTVVKVLCYKSESQLVSLEFFIDINSTMALGPNQPLTEMSTRSISWG